MNSLYNESSIAGQTNIVDGAKHINSQSLAPSSSVLTGQKKNNKNQKISKEQL
jgi:hypothetical protein